MSSFRRYSCEIKDVNLLVQTLKELKFEPKIKENLITISRNQLSKFSEDMNFVFNKKTDSYDVVLNSSDVAQGYQEKVIQLYAKNRVLNALKKEMSEYTVSENAETGVIKIIGRKIL